jgi:uncharacterized membrane protein
MSVPEHVNESIDAIVDLHTRDQRGLTRHQRGIERLALFLGRPRSLYLVTLLAATWIAANLSCPHFDRVAIDPPPFELLQGVATLLALLMATMVLVVQNRQNAIGQKRSILDLQINVLAERKAAKIIELLEELRRDLPAVANRRDVEAQEMSTALDPQKVADALERSIDSEDQPEEKKS